MAVAIVIFGRITGGKKYSCVEILTEIIRASFLNNFKKYPKLSVHNLILFGWIHYCFFVNLFYQSQFTSILTKKSFAKDIDTIEELYNSGEEIYAFDNQIKEIEKIYSGTNYSKIGERLRRLPEFTALWEANRDAVYKITISDYILKPFVTNHDRAVFVSRARAYRRNGR